MSVPSKPLVSICIPTYNGAKYIKDTIESALQQTYTNIEIIITDDKSSDNTLKICQAYANKDSRIKIYENPKNLGLIENWNESIEKATSEWIKFLFQDDLITPTCIEDMISAALQHQVNFVICNRDYLFQDSIAEKTINGYTKLLKKTENIFKSNTLYTPKDTASAISTSLFYNCIGEPPTFLFNKNFYQKSDFPTGFYQLMDYIFILNKILVHNFVFLNKKLVKFRIHEDSESMKNSATDQKSKENIYKLIHIRFYEKLLICKELLENPIYEKVKSNISKKNILIIKKFITLKVFKYFENKNVLDFFEEKNMSDYIISQKLHKYSLLKYKYLYFRHLKLIKSNWL